jgi:hypothetical protein
MSNSSAFHLAKHWAGLIFFSADEAKGLDLNLRYTFHNHFHPYVGRMIERLQESSLDGVLDPNEHGRWVESFFTSTYTPVANVWGEPKRLDFGRSGSYSVYNWELLFHSVFAIAVHLSDSQRFEEAQRWFHRIFDPTTNDETLPAPRRFWKFLPFRDANDITRVDELLRLLAEDDLVLDAEERRAKNDVLEAWDANLERPFQPHIVARNRLVAYKYAVVMKYLDNLIAWGDSLFRVETREAIMEALQIYVLAANLLGPRPQKVPPRGRTRSRTFAELRGSADRLGNALVELEGVFPFDFGMPDPERDADTPSPLFGMRGGLYFCIPPNEKLLAYWDTVADRLFKVRHCMTIEGVVRQLPLFDPPIDPGMLVKAAGVGIDVASIVSGLHAPPSPVRALLLIQKALELSGEVRNFGGSLLAALEKKDAETLALLRQRHEIHILERAQEVRYLQWQEAREATEALMRSRDAALERYVHYRRLFGEDESPELAPLSFTTLTEENFDEAYAELVGQYAKAIEMRSFPSLEIQGDSNPTGTSTPLYLSRNEHADLNTHPEAAFNWRLAAMTNDHLYSALAMLPTFKIKTTPMGVGTAMDVLGGPMLAHAGRIISGALNTMATNEDLKGVAASKTATYERRADEWTLHHNLAARELMQVGRQIIASLIREQTTRHEYENHKTQIEQSREVERYLQEKFTGQELYGWMQGELSKLHHAAYQLAFDVARKAEQATKHELMRPEVDAMRFVKFDYWDGGRKGLLSGETLHLDVKRMEMAYHEHNRREYELTKHVSLRQLDPIALVRLKETGRCELRVPEWVYDADCPGHYMRRIKTVGLSIPCVTGPHTGVHCTLSLLRSTLRRSPQLISGRYEGLDEGGDDRFVEYAGTMQSIVTSTGQYDGGMFETSLRDERPLPFEGAGADSVWRLELNAEVQQFDLTTITDVVLHIRYTAREGGETLREAASAQVKDSIARGRAYGSVRLFSVRHEFATEWAAFKNFGDRPLSLLLTEDMYPIWSKGALESVQRMQVFADAATDLQYTIGDRAVSVTLTPASFGELYTAVLEPLPIETPTERLTLVVTNPAIRQLLISVAWGAATAS